MAYPGPMQALIESFSKFPGIGEKTAQRFVFYLLRLTQQDHIKIAKQIMNLTDAVITCSSCFNYADRNPCALCANPSRDHTSVCVVAYSHEVNALERTGEYRGVYHVLGGNINMLDGITPDKLKIKELVERIKDAKKKIQEVVLAFNPDLEGESTTLYLSKILKQYSLRVTRLARGLPRGADIEYADEVTLGDAVKSRNDI